MRVVAEEPWNDSGIDVAEGAVLRFAASGEWWDKQFRAGPEGYAAPWYLRIVSFLLRCRRARWFEFTGEIDKGKGQTFPIGTRDKVTMPATGRLYLYANDVKGFYGNNRGELTVAIERAAG